MTVTVTVRYKSNNSGGSWRLTDDDWKALEAAGWVVEWVANDDADPDRGFSRADANGRWLGALATSAHLVVSDPIDEAAAIAEWARITGQDPDAEGCPCCGQPHYFSVEVR